MCANNGTGYPYWLRCSKCRGQVDRTRGWRLRAMGRTRPLARGQRGRGNPRATNRLIEVKCRDCGHVGWTRHKHAEDLYKAFRKYGRRNRALTSFTYAVTLGDYVEMKWKYNTCGPFTRIVSVHRMQGIYEAAMRRLQWEFD